MFITFLVSSIGHELVMGCITKKLRGYGFLAMMLQLPIVAAQRSKFVKGRKTFNVSSPARSRLFWVSVTDRCILERLFLDLNDSWLVDGMSLLRAILFDSLLTSPTVDVRPLCTRLIIPFFVIWMPSNSPSSHIHLEC